MTVILKNNAFGFLATAITASDTSIILTTGTGANFPTLGSGDYFYATIAPTSGTSEIVKCVARNADTLTVVRAQEGTSALSFTAGSRVELRVTAQSVIDAITDRVAAADQASEISIVDAGGYYASNNVEGALQEAASFTNPAAGGQPRAIRSKLADTVDPRDFGAIGNGLVDDTAALNAAFATGKIVDGGGLSYRVTPSVVIDSSATAGIGYGPGKTWFRAGVCRNITFVGDTSFGISANFLGKHQFLEKVTVTGDARLSSWYTTFQGFIVSGTTYINGDYPPDINWVGCYYNIYANCDFNAVVIDQRYGPFNLNNFTECQFDSLHVKNTGNVGYNPATQPFKDFHMNTFIGCEWLTNTGIVAPDGRSYPVVIDDAANVGGINRFVCCYMEGNVRGFYGKGLEVDNIHTSGSVGGVSIGGPAGNFNRLGYASPMSGEGGYIQRDVPHVYPAGQLAVGGDWSILNASGYPVCIESSSATLTVASDSTEPTGLGKAVTVSGAAFGAFDVVPQVNDITTSVDNLYSYAFIYKKVSGGDPIIIAYAADGSEQYGTANLIYLDNDWIMATGHTFGRIRTTSSSPWVAKFSALSMGRGSGVISPFTTQRGNKPLLDLSNGSSLIKDYVTQTLNTSGLGVYNHAQLKTMNSAGGNYDFYRITLVNFSGESLHLRANFSLASTPGGARYFYRESVLMIDGAGTMQETNLQNITGSNGTLSFSLSGNIITVRATTSVVNDENGRMAIALLGYNMGYSKVTVL